jgi:molybdenum cofactor biosynthesis enzyme MoaA
VEGNVHASRAWKGNDRSAASASLRLPFPAQLKLPSLFATRLSLFANFGRSLWRKAKSEPRIAMFLHDKHGRRISDLRISITDRCNYRCVYCRSGSDGPQFPEMPIADYLRMASVFVGLGITKVRLTGGEPLLRKGLIEMVRELAQMRTVEGTPLDIAITTNGHLLADMAQPLADAGLSRVTVSMDAVDPERFARITRVANGYEKVLAGVRAAQRAGLNPVKINCVLLRGFNDDQIAAFGRFAREEGVVVRFIEFMPLEEDRVWSPEIVVTLDEILRRMAEFMPLREIGHTGKRDRPALRFRRWHWGDRHHRAGVASVLRPLQPRATHFRWQDSHLPVLGARARSGSSNGGWRKRRRTG